MWRAALSVCWCAAVALAGFEPDHGAGMALLVDRVNVCGVSTAASFETSVDYMFVAGDVVDVWCVRWASACALNLTYNFSYVRAGGHGHVLERRRRTGARFGLLGVRTRLRPEHSGARLTCHCSRGPLTQTIHVTFIVSAPYDGVLDLRVNSKSIRYQQPALRGWRHYYVDYTLVRGERSTLECSTHVAGLSGTLDTHSGPSGTKIEVQPTRGELAEHVCAASNTTGVYRSVKVYFLNDLSDFLYDPNPLAINTSGSTLESYEHKGDRLSYYDFADGESLTLNCSMLAGARLKHGSKLVFGDTVEKSRSSITKQMKLGICDHNRTLDCSLLDNADNVVVRNIRILFWIKEITVNPVVIGVAVVVASKGSDVVIKCCVVGNPEPIVRWMFMSTNSTKFMPIAGTDAELHVRRADAARAGQYLCAAHNTAGTAKHITTLIVRDGQTDIEEASNTVEIVLGAAGVAAVAVGALGALCWRCRRRVAAGAAAEIIEMTESRIRRRSLPQVPYNPITSYECTYPENVYCEILEVHPIDQTEAKLPGKPTIIYDYAYSKNENCKILPISTKEPKITYGYGAYNDSSSVLGISSADICKDLTNKYDYADCSNRVSVCPISFAAFSKDPSNAYDYAECSNATRKDSAVQSQAVSFNDPQSAEASGVQNTMYYWVSSSSSSSSSM